MKWRTEIVASLFSGRLLCEFGEMHQFAEWLTGEPIFTHQFAHRGFVKQMQDALAKQIPSLCDFDWDVIDSTNWRSVRDCALTQFGPELDILSIGKVPLARQSFVEPLERFAKEDDDAKA